MCGHGLWIRDNDLIIVTGGIYLPPEIQTTPSGILMREWLVHHGVSLIRSSQRLHLAIRSRTSPAPGTRDAHARRTLHGREPLAA